MSSDRIEIINHFLGAWNQGDVDAVLEHITEDGEWHPVVVIEREVFRGHDGFRRFIEGWMATWESWNLEVEELREYGDQLLAFTRVRAKGRGSGVELDQPMAHLFAFRGDLLRRGDSFFDRDEAVAIAESRAQLHE